MEMCGSEDINAVLSVLVIHCNIIPTHINTRGVERGWRWVGNALSSQGTSHNTHTHTHVDDTCVMNCHVSKGLPVSMLPLCCFIPLLARRACVLRMILGCSIKAHNESCDHDTLQCRSSPQLRAST